jgi:hypothetical protein
VSAVGHALVLEGWPHFDAGHYRAPMAYEPDKLIGPDGGLGEALCMCGWRSMPVLNTEARRQAHARHVAEQS